MYFGGSLFATVAAAVSVSRSPRMMNLMMRNSWMVKFHFVLLHFLCQYVQISARDL